MTWEERVEEYCEENGYKICPFAGVEQICMNPDHCDKCDEEFDEYLRMHEEITKRDLI